MIRFTLCRLAITVIPLTICAQETTQPETAKPEEDKRILWIFTNHRTTDESETLGTLTPGGKLAIAWGDATDRAIFFQAFVLAGLTRTIRTAAALGIILETNRAAVDYERSQHSKEPAPGRLPKMGYFWHRRSW